MSRGPVKISKQRMRLVYALIAETLFILSRMKIQRGLTVCYGLSLD